MKILKGVFLFYLIIFCGLITGVIMIKVVGSITIGEPSYIFVWGNKNNHSYTDRRKQIEQVRGW